jgi:hypothetical protein
MPATAWHKRADVLFDAGFVNQPDSLCLSGFEEMASYDVSANDSPENLRPGNAISGFGVDQFEPLRFRITSFHADIVRELKIPVN